MTLENSPPSGGDQLEQMAAAVDADLSSVPAGPAPAGPSADEVAQNVAALAHLAVDGLTPLMPFLPECYTKEWMGQFGATFAAVAQKRGWQLDEVMTPEVALIAVCFIPTAKAVVMGKKHFAQLTTQPPAPAEPQPANSQAGTRFMG